MAPAVLSRGKKSPCPACSNPNAARMVVSQVAGGAEPLVIFLGCYPVMESQNGQRHTAQVVTKVPALTRGNRHHSTLEMLCTAKAVQLSFTQKSGKLGKTFPFACLGPAASEDVKWSL